MFKAAKMDAVILTHNIDQPFISQLEAKNEGIKFQRIDADLTETFKSKTSKKAEKELEEAADAIGKVMKKALKKDKIAIKVERLKNKKIASMITLSEESRRMQDMRTIIFSVRTWQGKWEWERFPVPASSGKT